MTDQHSLAETEPFLDEKLPLLLATGVRVESFDYDSLVLTAPLDPNHNHLAPLSAGVTARQFLIPAVQA